MKNNFLDLFPRENTTHLVYSSYAQLSIKILYKN